MSIISIIGAGQLGSRHLQALKAVNKKLEIYVVDPYDNSLGIARERYSLVADGEYSHEVFYLNDTANLPFNIDIAIVATTANQRYACTEALLKQRAVNYLILEKPLCQSLAETEKFEALLNHCDTRSYVNCGRRMMNSWKEIKRFFFGKRLSVEVSGSNWGLMCNLIHFIDIISFITGCNQFELNPSCLDQAPIPSKRPGNFELTGSVTLKYENGSTATITSFDHGQLPRTITISDGDSMTLVLEDIGVSYFRDKSKDWDLSAADFFIPMQSQLTTALVEEILTGGDCQLVSFEDSVLLHKQMMKPIVNFLNQYTELKGDIFPFT